MTIKRIISFVLFFSFTLLFFASCSSSSDNKTNTGSEISQDETSDEYQITVTYTSDEGGYVSGGVKQFLKKGEVTSAVTAVPNLCFKFKEWDDGVKTETRAGDSFGTDTEIKAIFEYCGLPQLYINYTADEIHKSYPVSATFTAKNAPESLQFGDLAGEIQGRGNSTWNHEKKPYKIKFTEAINLFGIGNDSKRDWVLLSNHCDQSLLRNYYAYNLAHKLGIGYQSTLVDVYLNGSYNGVYLLTGKPEASRHDIDTSKGGFLIELDNYYEGERNVDYFRAGEEFYTVKCDMTKSQVEIAKKYMRTVDEAIMSKNEDAIRKYIDVDSFVDMYLLQEYTKNTDAGWSSFYLYRKSRNDKLTLAPAWDFDIAMGNDHRVDNGSYDYIYVGRESGMVQQMEWFIALSRTEWFRTLCVERWNSVFKSEVQKNIEELKAYATLNMKELEENFVRWNNVFGNRINCEPDHILRLNTYEKHYNFFVEWLESRLEWLDQCFNNKELWISEINDKTNPSYRKGLVPKI